MCAWSCSSQALKHLSVRVKNRGFKPYENSLNLGPRYSMSPVGEAITERRAGLISEAIPPLAAAQTIGSGPRRTQHCLVACGW